MSFFRKTLKQVFFCEYCNIFKNSFFKRTFPVAATVDSICYFMFECNAQLEDILKQIMLKIYLNLHGFFITFVFLPRLEKNLRENFISHVHGLVYIKIETLTQVFPVSFSKFSRTYFSQITSGQLLL